MSLDARTQFVDAMRARALVLPRERGLVVDGQWHRCDVANKEFGHGRGDGSYWLNLNGFPRGGFNNWTDGKGYEHWHFDDPDRKMTTAERDELRREMNRMREQDGANLQKRWEQARIRATRQWKNAGPADPNHSYLRKKGVQPHGLRQDGPLLLVPMYHEGRLQNVQMIEEDGRKRGLEGGRCGGCHYRIDRAETDPGLTICICEGFATGASINEATGFTVFVAFSAGNLESVAKWVRQKYPDAQIIACADDDWKTEGNPGITKATKAAHAVGVGSPLRPSVMTATLTTRTSTT